MKTINVITRALSLIVIGICFWGCAAIEQGTGILTSKGVIKEEDRATALKVGSALRSSFSDITEEEEYYIGRSVAALILSKYPVYHNDALTTYINTVGSAVVYASDRPEIYTGYHFLILDSEEVNALAAPGGFVFITKGLLKRCRDEEMLAAVLAHEVGHVAAKHGLKSIKKSRLVDAFKLIGQEAMDRYGPEQLAQLTGIFEGVLGDIMEKLVERGYDRQYEYEADHLSVIFSARTGYSPVGLLDFLQTLTGQAGGASAKGWFRTHPNAEDRLRNSKAEVAGLKKMPVKEAVRTGRFQAGVKGLK